MRDQLTALSYAALISGFLLLTLEFLILDRATYWQTFPYMITPFVLGAAGLYWFRFRAPAEPETPDSGTSEPAEDNAA